MKQRRTYILFIICVLPFACSVLLAQAVQPPQTLAQPPRPTLTPRPQLPAPGSSRDGGESADIRWTQAISLSQSQDMLSIAVRGINIGDGSGRSDAMLFYDPAVLRLLDAVPLRAIDWVRARDDAAGTLTLALGTLTPGEQTTLQVRFRIRQRTSTMLRLVRNDAHDRANPLFLDLAHVTGDPIPLAARQTGSTITITGRGYKPGEMLALWANTRQGSVIAIGETFSAMHDEDGSVDLSVPLPAPDVVSIVVRGEMSEVLGVAEVGPEAGE